MECDISSRNRATAGARAPIFIVLIFPFKLINLVYANDALIQLGGAMLENSTTILFTLMKNVFSTVRH